MIKTTDKTAPQQRPVHAMGLRERQKLERRQRILASASALILKHGFEGATINAVADDAGVSPATVFNYFDSKDDLLIAMITGEQEDWLRDVTAFAPDPSADPVQQVCRLYTSISTSSIRHYDRSFWRQIESARIASPASPVVIAYDLSVDRLRDELLGQLGLLARENIVPGALASRTMARFLYDHWVDLFTELVRDETITLEEHAAQFEADVAELMRAIVPTKP